MPKASQHLAAKELQVLSRAEIDAVSGGLSAVDIPRKLFETVGFLGEAIYSAVVHYSQPRC